MLPMKYLAITVLLAILVGAVLHYAEHHDDPPAAASDAGWTQRSIHDGR